MKTWSLVFALFSAIAPALAKDEAPALVCDAEHLKPLFDKKDRAGCQKAFDETSNQGCNSAQDFANLLAAKKECLRTNLAKLFDEHTLKIDDENGAAAKKDNETENAFLKGIEKFCQSTCSRGDPLLWRTFSENCQAQFIEYRMKQLEALNSSSFELPAAHSSRDYAGGDRVKSAFATFAKALCKGSTGWKDKKAPKDCEKRALSQITIDFEVRKDACDLS